jgi:hypothetical protein
MVPSIFAGAIISGVQYLAPLRYMPIGEGGQGDYEECYDTHDAEMLKSSWNVARSGAICECR